MAAKERLIFPLDVPDVFQARHFIKVLREEVGLFKVGLELFVAAGPQVFQTLAAEAGAEFFLDLKFHDIPATVERAIQRLGPGVRFTTMHCEQGPGLRPATAAAGRQGIKVLGVTVLTSLEAADLLAGGIDPQYADPPAKLVLLRAGLARAAGCAGVVCAPPEAPAVRELCGPDFIVVCPGVRPEWAAVAGDDQKRIMTPFQAIRAGADYLVVGRPIRQAADPVAAARRLRTEIASALEAG